MLCSPEKQELLELEEPVEAHLWPGAWPWPWPSQLQSSSTAKLGAKPEGLIPIPVTTLLEPYTIPNKAPSNH